MSGARPRSDTRILLVEDEAIVARDLLQRLGDLGYTVVGTAASGSEAIALAVSAHPTLVFMDITIQGPIDGIETARRISSRMDVPIVFLTAHTDTGTIQRAKSARPYGYLIKPVDEREMLTTIEMAVGRHEADASARLMERGVASAGIGVIMVGAHDEPLRIAMCNTAFERMSGYSTSEVVGRSPWFLEGEATDRAASARLRQALAEQGECKLRHRLYRKDGVSFWADVVVACVRNPSGEATHSSLCLSDAPGPNPE